MTTPTRPVRCKVCDRMLRGWNKLELCNYHQSVNSSMKSRKKKKQKTI